LKETAKAYEELYSKNGIYLLYHYCFPLHLEYGLKKIISVRTVKKYSEK